MNREREVALQNRRVTDDCRRPWLIGRSGQARQGSLVGLP